MTRARQPDPAAHRQSRTAAAGSATAQTRWSPYNHLFRSVHGPGLLYGALSNVLIELDDEAFAAVARVGDGSDPSALPHGLDTLLRERSFLATEDEERGILLARRYDRFARDFASGTLCLTICPTLACNLRCPYCFEAGRHLDAVMDEPTMDRLLAFIGTFGSTRRVAVAWYGGEPTLAWDVVEELTGRIRAQGPEYAGAGLITNGVLLDEAKCRRLDDLGITQVQVTLDGPRTVHDARRVTGDGRPTFDRIVANLDALSCSGYRGSCAVRVNVDRTNTAAFVALRAELLERYAGSRIFVYPGRVHTGAAGPYPLERCLDGDAWAGFHLEGYRDCGIVPLHGFYPRTDAAGCTATSGSSFVVGPGGELYTCWEDAGRRDMAVGSLHEGPAVSRPDLLARYALSTDPHDDAECAGCSVLPICSGGCPNKHLRSRLSGEPGLEFCSPYRSGLPRLLDAYYDTFRTRELCAAVLGHPAEPGPGYRDVSPGGPAAARIRAALGDPSGPSPAVY